MALTDYSLERFPEHLVDHLDDIEHADLEFDLPDPCAEEQAHRMNLVIAEWIERLASSDQGIHLTLLPDHHYVGLIDIEVIGDGKMEKFEVGFFPKRIAAMSWLSPPSPTITLYSWRTSQLEFGVIWSSFGFRSEPVSVEAERAVYQKVMAAVLSGSA